MPDAGGEFEIVFFGLLLILMLIYMPNGLTGAVQKGMKRFRATAGSRTGKTAATERHEERSIGGGRG